MARIQKRARKDGSPAYVVKWRTPDGKDRSKGGFTTAKAARAYATKAEGAKLRGQDYDPKAGGITFRVAAQDWLASRPDLKPTTKAGYAYALAPAATCKRPRRRLGIDATFGGYPLNAITRQHITDWVANLVAAGKKPATVRQNVKVVRMVLAQAVADGRIPYNPAEHVKLPSQGQQATQGLADLPQQYLTAAQVAALVAATPWPYNVMVHLAAWSGLRAAELCGLQVGDVATSHSGGLLSVVRTVAALGKPGVLTYQTPKTRGSRRRVPLTTATALMLADYLAAHPRADEPTAPLFPAIELGGAQAGVGHDRRRPFIGYGC